MTEDILRQIGTIARAFDSIANIEFKKMNLNRGQYLYLVRISERPGIIANDLSDLLNIDRTTTARGVQKLVQHGLVIKKDDPKNKKIKHLFLTDKGKKLAQIIERENDYSNQFVLNNLNSQQVINLAKMLNIVEKNANNSWQFVKNGGRRKYQ